MHENAMLADHRPPMEAPNLAFREPNLDLDGSLIRGTVDIRKPVFRVRLILVLQNSTAE